jgi:prophage regulatory protein
MPESVKAAISTVGRGEFTTPDSKSIDALLWSLPEVLRNIPISRSGFLKGVKDGRFPRPVRLSPRRVAWRPREIESALADMCA